MDIQLFFQNYATEFEQGNKESIVAFLKQSIATAQAENDSHAEISILNEAAGYYRCISFYAESIAAAERALSLLKKLGYEDTVPYGTTLLNAGTAYRAAGDNVKAMELFISALTVLRAELEQDDYRLAGLYNNISEIHKEAGHYEPALDLLQQSAAIMAQKPDMEEDYAIVLSNLASVLLSLKQSNEAMALLEKAVKIFDRHGERDGRLAPHYAAMLSTMSEIHFRNGLFKKAAESYEEVLAYIAKTFGENMNYALTCQNCADAYEAAGEYAKAHLMVKKAHQVQEMLEANRA